jgi:hypothetical protein
MAVDICWGTFHETVMELVIDYPQLIRESRAFGPPAAAGRLCQVDVGDPGGGFKRMLWYWLWIVCSRLPESPASS